VAESAADNRRAGGLYGHAPDTMTALEKAFPTVAKLIDRRRASGAARSKDAARSAVAAPAPTAPPAVEETPPSADSPAENGGGRPRRGPKATNQRRRAPTVVGLDIDANHIVAAQVRVDGSITIERAAGAPLGPEIVRDGEVVDVEGLATALRTLFADHKLDRRVRVGLANQQVMVRTIELPPIDDARELEAAVRFKAQDEIPMPISSVVLDFRSLGVISTDAGPRQRIMLVAARRDMVERLVSAVTAAGLRPDGVDLAAFALIRALSPAPLDASERILYLCVGGLTNLVVAEGTTCVFTRVLNVGLESMTATVAERCVIPTLEARSLLREAGAAALAADSSPPPADSLVQPFEGDPPVEAQVPPAELAMPTLEDELTLGDQVPPVEHAVPAFGDDPVLPDLPVLPDISVPAPDLMAPATGDPVPTLEHDRPAPSAAVPTIAVAESSHTDANFQTAREVLLAGVHQIAADARNSLDFHLALGTGSAVTSVIASGPALEIPGFRELLASELGLPVTLGEVAEARPGAAGQVPLSRLSVAAGLAVAERLA
jgi:type IV pilus assembly protein PilM